MGNTKAFRAEVKRQIAKMIRQSDPIGNRFKFAHEYPDAKPFVSARDGDALEMLEKYLEATK